MRDSVYINAKLLVSTRISGAWSGGAVAWAKRIMNATGTESHGWPEISEMFILMEETLNE